MGRPGFNYCGLGLYYGACATAYGCICYGVGCGTAGGPVEAPQDGTSGATTSEEAASEQAASGEAADVSATSAPTNGAPPSAGTDERNE